MGVGVQVGIDAGVGVGVRDGVLTDTSVGDWVACLPRVLQAITPQMDNTTIKSAMAIIMMIRRCFLFKSLLVWY